GERGGSPASSREPCQSLRAARRSETRVCNGVCNWFGYTGAQPGTTWHDLMPAETPQPRARGTPGHDLAQRGTTPRCVFESCRAYHTDPRVRPRNGGLDAIWFSG